MRKKNKRILSMLLVIVCLAGVLAVPAFASELYEKQPVSASSDEEEIIETEPSEESAGSKTEEPETSDEEKEAAKTEKEQKENPAGNEGQETESLSKAETPEKEKPEEPVKDDSEDTKETADTGTSQSKEEPEAAGTEPEPKTLDEMTDEEILLAGESLLKTAKEMARAEGVWRNIITQ